MNLKKADMLARVPGGLEICKDDTVTYVGIYTGMIDDLVNVTNKLKWNVDERGEEIIGFPWECLSLDEICEQLQDAQVITVFIESTRGGVILKYRNHGDYWEKVGEIADYC